MPHPTPPATLAEELRRLTSVELSFPSRFRYVVLLLAAATMTAVVLALLLTERALPARTTTALSVLCVIGVSWVAFAARVLTAKRPLLGRHRVIAGRLGVTFSGVFVMGALVVGFLTSRTAAFIAAAMGAIMLIVAIALLMRARQRFRYLSRRRDELERLLRAN